MPQWGQKKRQIKPSPLLPLGWKLPDYPTQQTPPSEGPCVPSKQNSLMVQWFRVCPSQHRGTGQGTKIPQKAQGRAKTKAVWELQLLISFARACALREPGKASKALV